MPRVPDVKTRELKRLLAEIADLARHPLLANQVLHIRAEISSELNKAENAELVEFFDTESYNANLSVAENIVFGAPLSGDYQFDSLPGNDLINALLKYVFK